MAQKDYKTFEKFELPATRGKRNACEVCSKEFKLFVREHQCKRCGRAVCEECGSYKTLIYGLNFERKPHRMCKLCQPESQFIKNYIQHYKLTFGEGSDIGEKWAKRISVKSEGQRPPTRIETRREVVFSEEMFSELWNSYNYSLREFIGSIIFERKQNDIHKLMYGALQDLGSRMEVRLQTTAYLLVFLLCFCNAEEATRIAYQLLMLAKSEPSARENLAICLKQLNCQDGERRKLEQYVDYRYRKFCGMFSINCITFQGSLFLLDQVISKRTVAELDRYFAVVLFEQREQIIRNIRNKYEIDVHIIRSLNGKIIEKLYSTLCKVELKMRINNSVGENVQSPTRPKLNQLASSLSTSPPATISIVDSSPTEAQEIRRTVSTVQDEEALRSRVSELESIIASMKRSEPAQEDDKRNFRKKVSSFDDDARVKELAARNQQLEKQLSLATARLSRSSRSDNSSPQKNGEASNPDSERIIQDLEQRLKKQSIESSKLQLQLQGKTSILQKQLQLAIKEKENLSQELESARDDVRKGSKQIKSLEGTIQIMRMKLENMELEAKGSVVPSTSNSQELEELKKENSLLANSLKQKNQKIGDLLKQIKLLNFELEQKEATTQIVSVTNDKRPPETKQEQIRYSTPESSGPTSQQSFTLKVEQLEKQNSELRSTNDRLMAKLDELSRALMTEEQLMIEASRNSFLQGAPSTEPQESTSKSRDNCKPY